MIEPPRRKAITNYLLIWLYVNVLPMKYFLRILLILVASVFSSLVTAGDPVAKFVGHRGASYLAPENTLASIRLAWETGADAAECDIMLTKDNRIILFHDKNAKRLTGADLAVAETTYDELKDLTIKLKETNLDKYAGETIPLLSDVLPTVPDDRMLVIEIKTGPEILEYLHPLIASSTIAGAIAFIAFDYETIVAAKDLFPEVPCYYLSSFKSDINKRFNEIADSNLDGVDLRYKIINKKLVEKCNKAGLDVWCWTVNDPVAAVKMMNAGVTAITTDRPVWLRERVIPSL